ncbi:MAG TPA: DUF6049 family protein [Nocardioides sp.]
MIRRVVGVLGALTVAPSIAVAATGGPALADHGGSDEPSHQRVSERAHPQTSRTQARDTDPLEVTINSITPAVIPKRGPLRLTGTVTNVSDETWTLINLQPVTYSVPFTTPAEVEAAAQSDSDAFFGNRIQDLRSLDTIPKLEAGQTASYSLTIPHDVLADPAIISGAQGVYPFGVHALGQTAEGRDDPADGRARTFIPLVTGRHQSVAAAFIAPIRHDVTYARNGSLRGLRGWISDLGPGGRLRNILDFGTGTPPGSVTWLIDPGVLDAVQRLADGNPARDLGPASTPPDETGDETPEADASAPAAESGGSSSESSASLDELSDWASEWISRVKALAGQGQVLGLPYGDVDVSAATELDPRILKRAFDLSETTFADFDMSATPAVAPPSGYIAPDAITALDPDVTILASNAILPRPVDDPLRERVAVTADDHRIDLYDDAASRGGPGPSDSLAELAVRQRLVADAALRALGGHPQPLVMVMPFDWDPGTDLTDFFGELSLPWLTTLSHSLATPTVAPRLTRTVLYPRRQEHAELGGSNFSSADRLIGAGTTLGGLLSHENEVEREVTAQALSSTSYMKRADPTSASLDAKNAKDSILASFRQIHISAPPYVTLVAANGRFRVDLRNDLDQAVTVRIDATNDDDIRIQAPSRVALEGGSSTSVLLHVRSARVGVHQIRLSVTNVDGRALGPRAELPIRSSQSGRIIWVIIGAGLALLFVAIVIRLYRRIRNRHATDAPVPTDTDVDRDTLSEVE